MEQPVLPITPGILPAPAGGSILPPRNFRRPPSQIHAGMFPAPPPPPLPVQLSRRQAKKLRAVMVMERGLPPIPFTPAGVQKQPGGQKRPSFDTSKIVDLKYPYNMYPKWDNDRRAKLFQRIISIPQQFLTVGICKKAIVLAEMLGKTVSAKFLARKEELEKAKEDRKEMHKQKRIGGHQMDEGFSGQPSVRSAQERGVPMEEQPYMEPSYEWYAANIRPEHHIEPLEGSSFGATNGCYPFPSSSNPTNPLISGAPSEISSKISTLYEKFCVKTEATKKKETASSWQMGPPMAVKPPPISAPRGPVLRVPSPVDYSKNSAERPPSMNEFIPPEEISKTVRYTLEEPTVKLPTKVRFPITVQEIAAVSDIVLLCQLRDAPLVLKPFIHPTTRGLLRKLASQLGNGFQLMEVSKASTVFAPPKKNFKQTQRIVTNVWIQGISKLLTLGEGVDIDPGVSSDWAYASCLASLVYMMVIPYQLILAIQSAGEEYISLALYACKQRIRELIGVSRDPYYGQLMAHEGSFKECSDSVKELWANFINRMRHMGMTHWEDNKIRVPSYWQPFPKNCVNGFYFECVAEKQQFSWDGLVPNSYDIIPFDIEDFIATFAQSRFSCSAAEAGLVPHEPYKNTSHSLLYQLKHEIPNLQPSKFDPIVHLPFRDLLFKYGATYLNPMFTLFTTKYIGHRWGRRLFIKHRLIIEVDDLQKEHWKHVVAVSFEGIPYFFLGAKCAMDNFSSALFHCCSIVAQQLSAMMIIPRELCQFLERKGRRIVAPVIYGCRHRFAAFEALMRNPMFASLIVLESAELEFRNPLYPLAEYFYWRMRNTGWAYWMENRLIQVPMGMMDIEDLPSDMFFQFQESFEQANWTQINSPETYYDNFDVRSLMLEDRFPAHWEGGGWNGPEEYEEEGMASASSHPARQHQPEFKEAEKKELENALINEYRIPKCLLSARECETVLSIIRYLAGMGLTVLQMNVTTEPFPDGLTRYNCDLSWAGDLGWLLSVQYVDDRESALEYGAAWLLYKLLIRMGIVPPGLYKFICNNEARLPYVICSLSPFFGLLESLLPTYKNHEDQNRARDYLIDEMHQLCVTEWMNRAISLPPELLPSLPETEQLPFIRTGTMDFKEYEEWNRKASMYHRKAEILDMKRRSGAKKQQPGVKIGKTKFPLSHRREEEEMEEARYLSYGYGREPSTSSAHNEYVDPYGEDEYF